MIKDTIKRLCKEKGMTISALEKELGFSNYAIAKWDKSTPKIDSVVKVADYFGITVDALLRGVDDSTMQIIHDTARDIAKQEQRHTQRRQSDNDAVLILEELASILKSYGVVSDTNKTPIVGSVKCGPDGIAFQDIDGFIFTDDSLHGDLFALRTRGDSMVDVGISEGDLAIIRQQEDIQNGEIAAVLIDYDEAALKRINILPNGIALESANPAYQTRYFLDEEYSRVRILGKLVEIRKRF